MGTGNEIVSGCDGERVTAVNYCVQPPIINKGSGPDPPLGLCVGDCDYDSECSGDLRCYQREEYEVTPGCRGVKEDYDFCVLPPVVKRDLNTNYQLNVCEGDCDQDTDCKGDLKCF